MGTTQKVLAESGGGPGFLLLGSDVLKPNERIFARDIATQIKDLSSGVFAI